MVKNGKYISLNTYDQFKIGYGTVDHKNLKSIYLRISSWVLPNNDEVDFDTLIKNSRKKIKNLVCESKNDFFKPECIVDFDLRTKGISNIRKSFLNLEITFFVENKFDVKSKYIKNYFYNISKIIINDYIKNDKEYIFTLTKK